MRACFRRWTMPVCTALAAMLLLGAVRVPAQPRIAPSEGPAADVPFVIDGWTTEDGLPQNSVTALVRARGRYLWVGTNGGLVRFDGVRFTVFNRTTTPRLPNDRVQALLEDRRGALWVGTQGGGLLRLNADGQTATFTARDGLPSDAVLTLLETRAGVLWVGTETGLARFDGRRFVADPTIAARHVRSLFEGPDGSIWVGTSERLYHLGMPDDLPAEGVELPSSRDRKPIVGIARGADGALWVATDGGGLLRREGKAFVPVPGPGGQWRHARSLVADAAGTLWVGTGAGVLRIGREGVRAIDASDGLATGLIRTLYPDDEGTAWIGTDNGGIHRLSAPSFRLFGAAQGLASDVVFSVTEDRAGDVWVGTNCGGLARLRGGTVRTYGEADGLANTCITSVLEDRQGRLWAGSYGGGLFRRAGERFVPFEGTLPGRSILALYEDRAGAVWIGTYEGGVSRLYDGRLTTFDAGRGLPGNWVRGVLEGRDGVVYVATNAGVARLPGGTLQGRRLPPLTTAQGLSSNDVRALYEDADGGLWIGTYGAGLNLVRNGRTTAFTAADGLPENVVSAIVEDAYGQFWMTGNRGITRVARADLEAFAAGRRRILNAHLFGREAGIEHAETNGGFQPAAWRGADGRIWFPTFSGAAVVDPSRLGLERPPPAAAVETIRTPSQAWTGDGPVALPRGARQFDVAYTGFDLAGARQTRFRYRLRGGDTTWVEAGTRRVAYFTNVAPGRYTFEVTAASPAGVWNAVPATVDIEVPAYPLETTGVRLLAFLGFIGAVAWGVRLRLRQMGERSARLEAAVEARTRELREQTAHAEAAQHLAEEQRGIAEAIRGTVETQAAELEAINTAQSRFFANLSHEFRTPLTLIIGPIETTAHDLRAVGDDAAADELETTLRSARRLLRLIDQLLDLARLESRALPFRPVEADLAAFVREIGHGFMSLASHRGIALDVHTPDAPVRLAFDVDALEKIVFNLIANALKFTPEGGRIGVRVGTAWHGGQRVATFAVRDTGIGIPAAALPHLFERFYQTQPQHARTGAGIGLALVRELVDLHGGRIEVESEVGFGSTFTVSLPMATAPVEMPRLLEMPPMETPASKGDGADPAAAPRAPALDPRLYLDPEPGPVDLTGTAVAASPRVDALRDSRSADPVLHDEAKAVDAVPDVRPSAPSPLPLVLVVEDHDDVRAFTRRHLGSIARVIEARDGDEGLRMAFEHRPDLVITDVTMPGLDGIGLCQQLKADPRTALTPVLLLTARAAPESRVDGLDAGADDYLVKPFVVRELQARVENLLRSRVQLREAYGRTVTMAPTGVHLSSADEQFVTRVREAIEAHLGDPTYDIPALAEQVGVSLSQLHRRIKALTGQPPVQLLRSMRLTRAADLLAQRVGSVAEVAFAVGFNSLSYFARCFREQYGVTPSEYAGHREGHPEAAPAGPDTSTDASGDLPAA